LSVLFEGKAAKPTKLGESRILRHAEGKCTKRKMGLGRERHNSGHINGRATIYIRTKKRREDGVHNIAREWREMMPAFTTGRG